MLKLKPLISNFRLTKAQMTVCNVKGVTRSRIQTTKIYHQLYSSPQLYETF